jgi:YD repeat-containing protein
MYNTVHSGSGLRRLPPYPSKFPPAATISDRCTLRCGSNAISRSASKIPTDASHSTVTDSLGRATTYTIDQTGGKIHSTNISGPGCRACGEGGNASLTYDVNLNIISKTDANGNVTIYTYDSMNNMLTMTEAGIRTTSFTYDPQFNQVTSITDPNRGISTFSYDQNGNLIAVTDAGQSEPHPALFVCRKGVRSRDGLLLLQGQVL